MKKTKLAASLSCCLLAQSAWAMSLMSDEELADTNGQALFNLSYLAPTDAGNHEAANNIGFYKLGIEAEVAANLNVRKLQLGCGGINGAGACDIDIDNVSLSGLGLSGAASTTSREERVQSDAIFTNPFYEFAIKNPNQASTREVVGFRVSNEKTTGLMTVGTENTSTPNGINTLSGFMRIQSDSSGYIYGKANTMARTFNPIENAPYIINGVPVNQNNAAFAHIVVLDPILAGLARIKIQTNGISAVQIPEIERVPFIRPGVVVNQNRLTELPLKATLSLPPINLGLNGEAPVDGIVYGNPIETPIDWAFTVPTAINTTGGELAAEILSCDGPVCGLLPLLGLPIGAVLKNAYLSANVVNIKADATINQGLGYIHALPINSAIYLSVQQQAMRWPGSYSGPNPDRTRVDGTIDTTQPETVTDIAQRGWWLSLADPVNLGSVDPLDPLDVAPIFPDLAANLSTHLLANDTPIGLEALVNALLDNGNEISLTAPDIIDMGPYPLKLTLRNLLLDGQSFAPNCYGTLRFC